MIPTPPKNDGSRDARSMPEPYSSLWVSLCSNDFTTITDELCDSFMRNLNLSLNERQTVKSYLIVCGMVRAKEAMIALLEDFQKTFIANQDSFGDEAVQVLADFSDTVREFIRKLAAVEAEKIRRGEVHETIN